MTIHYHFSYLLEWTFSHAFWWLDWHIFFSWTIIWTNWSFVSRFYIFGDLSWKNGFGFIFLLQKLVVFERVVNIAALFSWVWMRIISSSGLFGGCRNFFPVNIHNLLFSYIFGKRDIRFSSSTYSSSTLKSLTWLEIFWLFKILNKSILNRSINMLFHGSLSIWIFFLDLINFVFIISLKYFGNLLFLSFLLFFSTFRLFNNMNFRFNEISFFPKGDTIFFFFLFLFFEILINFLKLYFITFRNLFPELMFVKFISIIKVALSKLIVNVGVGSIFGYLWGAIFIGIFLFDFVVIWFVEI